jgi:hypothetical protein
MSTNDADFYQAARFSPEEPPAPPRQRGCFFYGCIIASILAVLMVILIAIAGFFLYRLVNTTVEQYTATTPRELPKVEMPAEEVKALKDRVEAFRQAVHAGTPIEPLVLTSDDVNQLIEDSPDLKGKVFVTIEGNKLKGQVSIPLDALADVPFLGMFKGRYLNGEADLKASLQDGVLIVTLDSFEVNGQSPPEEMMTRLRQENLAKEAYKNPDAAELFRKLESLEINDGKIILKVRAKGAASSGAPADLKELPDDVLAPPTAGDAKGGSAKGQPAEPKVERQSAPAEAPLPRS